MTWGFRMTTLRVLILEDSDIDEKLLLEELLEELRRAGFQISSKCVDTAEKMQQALLSSEWDVVLSDHNTPEFSALHALRILRQSKQKDLPLIIVSSGIGEFFSISTHELKTPLTSARVASKLETVAHASTRRIGWVDGLLDVTRVRIGRLVLCLKHFDITETARSVIKRIGILPAKGAAFAVTLPKGPRG
jgi:CheY-like chemotaxis protein